MAASSGTKARPARAPAPPVPPFEALDRTHARVIEVLGQFDRLLAHIDENGADEVARGSAAEILEFFSGHARQHHADEERFVFPQLLAKGDAELVQSIKRLQQDHGWLEEDWLELAPQIEAIAEGYNWYDLVMLRHALPVFTALYYEHIGLEESLVYPAARRHHASLEEGAKSRS
ncbi:MAG: hemerythrin domain-containing protein [Rubrivivax sp.]